MTQSEQDMRVPAPSKAGWPDRYFAVIFTTQRTLSDEDMYSLTSQRMVELAQQQPGFLGLESVRGEDESASPCPIGGIANPSGTGGSILSIWLHSRWGVRNSTAGTISALQRWWRTAHSIHRMWLTPPITRCGTICPTGRPDRQRRGIRRPTGRRCRGSGTFLLVRRSHTFRARYRSRR